MTLPHLHARHVLRRIRQGASSSPVVVETPGGNFVLKLRGAGHGTLALVAELVVGALADRLGLPVPERALVELDADFQSDDHNDELADATKDLYRRLGASHSRRDEAAQLSARVIHERDAA